MAIRINPFHELYVGDSIDPDKFVNLFSDVIVEHALSLFQPGHVILKGLPGTGKSMLLNLLKPDIRLAYSKTENQFPVPENLMKFVGAGINLKRSGIIDFGQRPIDGLDQNNITSPLFFADFLNYWVVADILNSIKKLYNEAPTQKFIHDIGIDYNKKKINSFSKKLSEMDCWSGYLSQVTTFEQLERKIHERITNYRAYLNYNIANLNEEIHSTKSLIGIPISKTVELLREYYLIDSNTEIYIRIDQYEELAWLDENTNHLGISYQEIIHKLLGSRDTNVSYRIGTRHFAWTGDKKMFGSTARLEKKRNYNEISIDSVLRRKENSRTWVFPEFAEDIFLRRIKNSNYKFNQNSTSLLSEVFGLGYKPSQTALNYLPNQREKAVLLDDNWPKDWKLFLTNLAAINPLSARLGEAWCRQKGKEKVFESNSNVEPYPWEIKVWWRKERIEQALMQIASRNRQQLIWYGKDDILGLSGGNILIFLSLCQHIWDVWIRDKRNERADDPLNLPELDSVIQSAGIRETSSDWHEDISNEKGGKERKEFINYIGALFYKTLVEDKAMSYPGHNGFSISIEELESNNTLNNFINGACDYGDLYDMPHTSKMNDKKPRKKFYLNPILSPYFRIPYAHTKEPWYISSKDLIAWLIDSKVFASSTFGTNSVKSKNIKGNQPSFEFQ